MTIRLLAAPKPDQARDLNVANAAEESCRIVGAPGFYPERKVGQDYARQFKTTLEQRLSLAGARLAGLLNRTLAP